MDKKVTLIIPLIHHGIRNAKFSDQTKWSFVTQITQQKNVFEPDLHCFMVSMLLTKKVSYFRYFFLRAFEV